MIHAAKIIITERFAAKFAMWVFGVYVPVLLVIGHWEAAWFSFTTAWFAWCWLDAIPLPPSSKGAA